MMITSKHFFHFEIDLHLLPTINYSPFLCLMFFPLFVSKQNHPQNHQLTQIDRISRRTSNIHTDQELLSVFPFPDYVSN
ncbi:hypothetical protein L2E82_47767 [Cichorium intybus]|uniref:Uncharacterized protein n=1 Tax=Cichorium intybus TaxID=13427 RepID=A0ACB8YWX3_CICIN|nr:hypothetical protein L2E82_47767 [Cichorium intybus]